MMKVTYLNYKPSKYFCFDCKQLRRSLRDNKTKCGNRNSKNIITGKPGALDKEDLLRKGEELDAFEAATDIRSSKQTD